MHKTAARDRPRFFDAFLPEAATLPESVEIVVAPPFVSIPAASSLLRGSRVHLGAQTMHWELEGAFTGEISAPMLREFGVSHVILGHSERRAYCNETDRTVHLKVRTALEQGLTPIVAVGETLDERNAGATDERVIEQTRAALDGVARGPAVSRRHRLRAHLGDRHGPQLRSARGRSRDGDDSRVPARARRNADSLRRKHDGR